MDPDEMDFEAEVAEAFRRPMARRDSADITASVLAEAARTDRRRSLVLALGALVGVAVAISAAALTGILQGIGRLAGALASGAPTSLADPSMAAAVTWTAALLAAGLATVIATRGALQDF